MPVYASLDPAQISQCTMPEITPDNTGLYTITVQ